MLAPGACDFVTSSHAICGTGGLCCLRVIKRLADMTAGTSAAYWQAFLDSAIRDRSTSFDMGSLTKPGAASLLPARHAGKSFFW